MMLAYVSDDAMILAHFSVVCRTPLFTISHLKSAHRVRATLYAYHFIYLFLRAFAMRATTIIITLYIRPEALDGFLMRRGACRDIFAINFSTILHDIRPVFSPLAECASDIYRHAAAPERRQYYASKG